MLSAVRHVGTWSLVGVALLVAGAHCYAQDQDEEAKKKADEVADQARTLLQKRCAACHGQDINFPGLNFEDFESLYSDRGKGNFRFVEPNQLERSLIWEAIDTDRMPQNGTPFSAEEKAIVRTWILSGASVPPERSVQRPRITELSVLKSIHDYLMGPKFPTKKQRELVRFFTIHHLHNDWKQVSDERLRLTRAALSKALNCTSRKDQIVIPESIDADQTIFAVDIGDLGWNDELWQKVQKAYPYRMTPVAADEATEFQRIKQAYGAAVFPGVTHLRADWFVVSAVDSRRDPASKQDSLYDLLLDNPKSLAELEKRLGVKRVQDFESEDMVRGGVIQSGVSAQNRLIDGHGMENRPGWYWISYDFQRQSGRGNIIRFPLGPKKLAGATFDGEAFEHGGSEVIYPLTNGLHAYFLVGDKEERIDTGPISIVSDNKKTSGTPEIVNGLSCIACHKHGTITFEDVVRNGSSLQGNAQQKLLSLYDSEKMNGALAKTRRDYLRALDDALRPFLAKGDTFDVTRISAEPVSTVARWYLADVDLDTVAAEMGVPPSSLQGAIQGNLELQRLGLGLLLKEHGRMKRSMWTADERGVTAYQAAAQAMGRGNP